MSNNKVVSIGNYILDKKIGKGSFAQVYRAHNKDNENEKYAIKVVNIESLKQKIIDNFKLEIDILKKISHENIVKLYDTIEKRYIFYLVIDYCDGGDLNKFIKKNKKLSYDYTQFFYRQIVKGMKYLYDNNIIHRDLKSQNILLCTNGVVKITDFGFVTVKDQNMMMNTLCGSPLYMAPEIMKNKSYGANVDLWSAGILLYEMLVGEPPFTSDNIYNLIKKIEQFNIYFPDDISDECKELILSLLKINPNERITFNEFFEYSFNIGKEEKERLEKERLEKEKKDKEILENEILENSELSLVEYIKIYVLKIFESIKSIECLINEKYYYNSSIKFSLVLYIYILKLLSHIIEVVQNTLKKYDNLEMQDFEKKFKTYYTEILNNTETVYKFFENNENNEKLKTITAYEIIYLDAIEYFKYGLSCELLDCPDIAKKRYILSISLLESLTMDKPLTENDQNIIGYYLELINQRIKICQDDLSKTD